MIVTLCVRNSLLTMATVRQGEREIANVPIGVGLLLQKLDVHVWNSHGKTIIKTDSTYAVRKTQCWHSGDIFCHSYAVWIEAMQHFVRERQVHHAVIINCWAEVLMVPTRETTIPQLVVA